MSESKFHRNHKQHISFSEKLDKELKKTGQDVIKQLSSMNQKISDLILHKVVNLVVRGIFSIIPDLQDIVIKSNVQEKSNADLQDVVKRLNQFCNEAVQEYHSDCFTLKQQFEKFLQNILLEAEALLNIIKRDDLHDFKHELVEKLKDIFYTIEIGLARIRIENYSHQDIRNEIETIKKEFFEDIATIENSSSEVLKNVHVNIKYSVKYGIGVAHRFNIVASNFHDVKIQNKVLETAYRLNCAASDYLLSSDIIKNTKEAIAAFTQMTVNALDSYTGLIDFIDTNLEDKKDSENLSEIAKWVIIVGFVVNKHTGKSVRHDSLFA